MNRRDLLLLRTGQPAVLSCERLYMRYVDAQADGTTAQLFEALARDLSGVKALQLTDTAWLASEDFKRELDAVLGGRIDCVEQIPEVS